VEPRILAAYAIIAVMVGAAIYLIARFRRERARRRDMMRGRYRKYL
jgi:HAMP domain-containing protein